MCVNTIIGFYIHISLLFLIPSFPTSLQGYKLNEMILSLSFSEEKKSAFCSSFIVLHPYLFIYLIGCDYKKSFFFGLSLKEKKKGTKRKNWERKMCVRCHLCKKDYFYRWFKIRLTFSRYVRRISGNIFKFSHLNVTFDPIGSG